MKECVDGCNTVHYQGVNVSYDFPKRARYNPPESVILTIMDFFRGEIVEFESFSTPSSSGLGYAFYRSVSRPEVSNLVDISDLAKMESARVSRAKHYFLSHPDCNKLVESYGSYPATPDGKCMCAKEAGYTNECNAGEGFFDCRDCWSTTI